MQLYGPIPKFMRHSLVPHRVARPIPGMNFVGSLGGPGDTMPGSPMLVCGPATLGIAACAQRAGVDMLVGPAVPPLLASPPNFVAAFAAAMGSSGAGAIYGLLDQKTLAYYVPKWTPALVSAYYAALAPYVAKLAAGGATSIVAGASPQYINNGILSGAGPLLPATAAKNIAARVALGTAPAPLADVFLVTYKSNTPGTFWTIQGDLIKAAQIASIAAVAYFGAELLVQGAPATAPADVGAGSTAAIDTAAPAVVETTAPVVEAAAPVAEAAAPVAEAAAPAASDVLAAVTVTPPAIAPATPLLLTPAAQAALAASAAAGVAASVANPTPDLSQPDVQGSPTTTAAPSNTSPLTTANQAANLAKTGAGLVALASGGGQASAGASPLPIIQLPSPTGGAVTAQAPAPDTTLGVSNTFWLLAIGVLGVALIAGGKK